MAKKIKRKTHWQGYPVRPENSPFYSVRKRWTDSRLKPHRYTGGCPSVHTDEWLMDIMQDSKLRDNLFKALNMFCDIYEFRPAYMFRLLTLAEEGNLEAYYKIIILAETVNIYSKDAEYVHFICMEDRRIRKFRGITSVLALRPQSIKPMKSIHLRSYSLSNSKHIHSPTTCGHSFREFRMLRRLAKQLV